MRRSSWGRVGVAVAAVMVACVGAGCWAQEGFDAARGGFNPFESVLTAANVNGLTRAWTADAGAGNAASTPIVVANRVFVGSGDAVEAFDTGTGVNDWTTHNNDLDSSGLTGFVGPLTAVGTNVLAPVSWGVAGGVFDFNQVTGARTGSPTFHFGVIGSIAHRDDAGAQVNFAFGSGGPFITELAYGGHTALLSTDSPPGVTSPAIVGRHVLVGVASSIASFSLDNCVPEPPPFPSGLCSPEWSTSLPAAPHDPVGIGTTAVAVALANGDVQVRDLATGALQWTAHTGATDATAPAVANGHLYVGASDGHLYAFASPGCGLATCAPDWSALTTNGAAVSHQPAVANNVVYVGTSTGRVYAFAANGCGMTSCASLWDAKVDPSATVAPVSGPVVSGGTVYVSSGSALAAFRLAR